ncbi:hypothetical protein ACI2KR_27210 [Pseudomonas luteola]
MMSERDDFEAGLNPRARIRNEHGDYVLPSVQDRWSGWLARSESENANFAKLEAQLAEAVWMLNCVMGRDVFGNGTAEVLDRRINAFLASTATPEVNHD